MKIRVTAFILLFAIINHYSFGQGVSFKWWNPGTADFQAFEGQAWPNEVKGRYDRLPARAEGEVPGPVWNLSTQSAGLMVRFRASTDQIKVRYVVGGNHALPHMPATGVSGVDLYTVGTDGDLRWCAGKFAFGDTIVFDFKNIEPNDTYHKRGREYRLFLPLYNKVKWMEIGVPEANSFAPLAARPDKPIVVYGTSIAQGACASRPGMAWTSILGRKMDDPLINLGFSGNGKLDKSLVDLLTEIDAKIYILDCLPNLTVRNDPNSAITPEEIERRLLYAVRTLKEKRPGVPILLAEHAGYTDEAVNKVSQNYYQQVNAIQKETFKKLVQEGVTGLYLLPKEDFGQDIETMVDGTHPSDLGMMRYAEGYEKHLRIILHEPVGEVSTTRAATQMRDGYDWEVRHKTILELNALEKPKIVVIGNSITHFWGGSPAGHRISGPESWNKTFGEEGARNMGYGWDRIENVIWRAYHGELDGYQAKQIFVNIGTNNLDYNKDEEIVKGWALMIDVLKTRQPKAELVLLGIYPRRKKEERIVKLNKDLKRLAETAKVRFIDPGKVFVKSDGTIDESFFSDGLHPNAKGYDRLGAAIRPFVK
jgi:lysophospholipase L1-like esterase